MRVRVMRVWEEILSGICTAKKKSPPILFLSADKDYTVYGLSWHRESVFYGAVFLCEVLDDHGNLISAPMDIFDVVDSQIPNLWRIEKRETNVFLWPEVFLKKFFFDDLSEGVPESVEAFRNLQALLEAPDARGAMN